MLSPSENSTKPCESKYVFEYVFLEDTAHTSNQAKYFTQIAM